MNERDPRMNPAAQDVLKKGSRERHVKLVLRNPFVCRTEEDHKWRCRPNGPMKEVDSTLKQWRKWAATAVVVRQAQEPK